MINIIIIIGLILGGFYVYKQFTKSKKTKDNIENKESASSKRVEKEQILSRLNDIKDESSTKLVNCEITFLARTEVEDYSFVEKIYQKYPKTLSRPIIDITPLYKEFDVKLVDKSIEELLESFGAKDFEAGLNQPFLRFEYYIQKEAKEKARKLFDDFLIHN